MWSLKIQLNGPFMPQNIRRKTDVLRENPFKKKQSHFFLITSEAKFHHPSIMRIEASPSRRYHRRWIIMFACLIERSRTLSSWATGRRLHQQRKQNPAQFVSQNKCEPGRVRVASKIVVVLQYYLWWHQHSHSTGKAKFKRRVYLRTDTCEHFVDAPCGSVEC